MSQSTKSTTAIQKQKPVKKSKRQPTTTTESNVDNQENAMSTAKTKSKKSTSTSSTSAETTPVSPAAASPATNPAVTVEGLAMPPPIASIPVPPAGFVADSVMSFRGVMPRSSELNALPIALQDVSRFTNYDQLIGGTAPSMSQIFQALTIANAWSATRVMGAAWDAYCETQEGIAWTLVRPILQRLRPAYQLAVATDQSLTTKYPGLTTLLSANQVIAQKGAATRKRNRQAKAAGDPATHGAVGKAATKRAEKAALAASEASETKPAPAASTSTNGATH